MELLKLSALNLAYWAKEAALTYRTVSMTVMPKLRAI
jgi:hypothetical protein